MKLKKVITGLFLCAIAVIAAGGIYTNAASKKVTVYMESTVTTHSGEYIYVLTSIKKKNVASIEYKAGSIKKTADKYWKDAEDITFYTDDETGKTKAGFRVYENGTYSVRVTAKSGKKYVKRIKINNIEPCSDRSILDARIKEFSGPDKKGEYTITVDYYGLVTVEASKVLGRNLGDKVRIGDRGIAKIVEILGEDSDHEYTVQQTKVQATSCVVLIPDDPKSFYGIKSEDDDIYYSYNGYRFGLFMSYSGDVFVACQAYDEPEEYRDELYDKVYSNVKLKVNDKTVIRPAYTEWSKYGMKTVTLSVSEYLALRNNRELQEEKGIYVYEGVGVWIYESYDKKTGEFTDYVSEIVEIYTP